MNLVEIPIKLVQGTFRIGPTNFLIGRTAIGPNHKKTRQSEARFGPFKKKT